MDISNNSSSEEEEELGSDDSDEMDDDFDGEEEELSEQEDDEVERKSGDSDDGSGNDEEEEEEKESEGDNDKDESPSEISGWADSIAKILKSTKPKNKTELILSRARKDYEVNKSVVAGKKTLPSKPLLKNMRKLRQNDDLEIVPLHKPKTEVEGQVESAPKKESTKDDNANTKKITKKDDDVLSLKVQRRLELKQKKLELAWENLARMNADITDPVMERDLVKMATKGVVQLFNAISMQQKTIKTKLKSSDKSEFKKDKILNQTKDIFDSAMSKSKKGLLNSSNQNDESDIKEEVSSSDDDAEGMRGTISIKTNGSSKRKSTLKNNSTSDTTAKKKPVWNALHDDFMLNAKLKDWDKESDSD